MRRGMTLIELIFSMVIIALAFTVLPKILEVAGKSAKTTLKEEAMYNAVALMGLVCSLAWDEQNTQTVQILTVSNGDARYQCPYDDRIDDRIYDRIYRKGGFIGSRNCKDKVGASSIGDEDGESEPDDIDDLDGEKIPLTNFNNTREYNASVKVLYVHDYDTQFSSSSALGTTNVKMVTIQVEVPNTKQEILGSSFAKLSYFASNIGQLRIFRVPWKKP